MFYTAFTSVEKALQELSSGTRGLSVDIPIAMRVGHTFSHWKTTLISWFESGSLVDSLFDKGGISSDIKISMTRLHN
jgi:hypothetical protein